MQMFSVDATEASSQWITHNQDPKEAVAQNEVPEGGVTSSDIALEEKTAYRPTEEAAVKSTTLEISETN